MRTISFKITAEEGKLVLDFKGTKIYFDNENKVSTEECPDWLILRAISTKTNIFKAVNIIAEKEETNTNKVLEFLVKGFSPSATKQIMDNYVRDEFILGTHKDIAYILPEYIHKLFITYEERSGEQLDIYFPSGEIRTMDEVYLEIEQSNKELEDNGDIKFIIDSFINAEYITEVASSILFGNRKPTSTQSI